MSSGNNAKNFAAIRKVERDTIERLRTMRGQAQDLGLLGLAFSGGGIRSATFNLGVTQALARAGLLRRVDYLSTNSGGGYIGSWLLAWIRREGIAGVQSDLSAPSDSVAQSMGAREAEPDTITFLRKFSNYLTPSVGFLSADTWTMVATYVRNLLVSQSVLVLALAALLLLPRAALWISKWLNSHPDQALMGTLIAAVVSLLVGLAMIAANMLTRSGSEAGKHPWYSSQGGIQALIVMPFLAAAWLASHSLWFHALEAGPGGPGFFILAGSGLYTALWLLGGGIAFLVAGHGVVKRKRLWPVILVGAALSGAVGGALVSALFPVASLLNSRFTFDAASPVVDQDWLLVHVSAWGPPLVTAVFILTAVAHIGLVGRTFDESDRQWWSRLGAWLLIYSAGWFTLFAIAFYAPAVLVWLGNLAAGVGVAWLASTVGGVLAAKDSSGAGSGAASLGKRVLLAAAPPVFVVGLLGLLALAIHLVIAQEAAECAGLAALIECDAKSVWRYADWHMLAAGGVLFGIAVALSWRIDVNDFSMHLFYRSRLIRAYLGASKDHPRRDKFTGFDPSDDLALACLSPNCKLPRKDQNDKEVHPYDGPYPILNTTLNLVAGDELAWQERKGASFVFTPRYIGFDTGQFRSAPAKAGKNLSDYAYVSPRNYDDRDDGITLGTAMAISGAAASPNMGYQSSPALAFLLTVFNVRLGWWLGNPRHRVGRRRMSPRFALFRLVAELFGLTNENSKYVYLSDGGHFENLALYELVRRRCPFIIVTDAGADPELKFEDIGNAIRKCRIDFGIDIELDLSQIRYAGDARRSLAHCAVGTIHYEKVYDQDRPGTLIYIKATLTGDEPEDLLNYATEHPDYPHESTADQWFTESQFESYRRLGEHIATTTLKKASDEPASLSTEALFVDLRYAWHPRSAAIAERFTEHTRTLNRLVEIMRNSDELRFLDAQIYPEWGNLTADARLPISEWRSRRGARPPGEPPRTQGLWLPGDYGRLRSGFYFCQSVIQLMEDVYIDLNLEADYDHPDNRGWMNLFKHWAWSGMFRATWSVTAATFGVRFQTFCERRFGLQLGQVEVEKYPQQGAQDNDSLLAELEPLRKAHKLNAVEEEIIRGIVKEHGDVRNDVCVLEIAVTSPTTAAAENHSRELLRFTFGIALMQPDGLSEKGLKISYFRVRDHLRKMGLARRAMKRLRLKHKISGVDLIDASALPEWARAAPGEEAGAGFDRLFKSVWYEQPPEDPKKAVK